MRCLTSIAFWFIILISTTAYSQKVTITGIVVDSASLTGIPNVNIRIKHSERGTTSKANGSFYIEAAATDTLLFTSVGFKKLQYPLFDNEDEVLIRLTEDYVLLKEAVTSAPHIEKYKVPERKIVTPSALEGIFSPFTYFSKTEHEKRKLVKLRAENNKVKTYVQVVNDEDVRDEIMERFSLSPKDYFELLAKFNQQNRQAAYTTNPDDIKRMLFTYFKSKTQ